MRLKFDVPHGFGKSVGAGGPEGNAVAEANNRSGNSAAYSVEQIITNPPGDEADLIIEIDVPSEQMSQTSIDQITSQLQDRLGPDVSRRTG
jgi:hypothetical protein